MNISRLLTADGMMIALIALLPILGWIWFFQRHHPEKRSYVILTFMAGMLSVLPIKFYEQYWGTAIAMFESINMFEYLAELVKIPSLDTFLAFVSVNAIVALFLFIFVALMMFALEVLSGDNSIWDFERKMFRVLESPLIFVMVGLLCGVGGFFLHEKVNKIVWFFVIVAILEEYVKHLCVRFSDEFKINSIEDAINFSILVALGFAFVENIFYFTKMIDGGMIGKQLLIFIMLRSTISVIAHVSFSAILGYYYGIARFATEIYQSESQMTRHPIVGFFHKVLHLKTSLCFREEKMMEGLLIAMMVHAIFNSMLEYDQMNLLIPALCVLFCYVLHLLHKYDDHKKNGRLESYPST